MTNVHRQRRPRRTKDILVLGSNWEVLSWEPTRKAIFREATGEVLYRLGSPMVYHGGLSKAGQCETQIETSSIIVINGTAKNRQYRAPMLNNDRLFFRDRFICAYCGGKFKKSGLTRDHVLPRSRGGEDKWTNVVAACKDCNQLKSNLMPGEKLKGRLGPQGTGKMEPLYVPYVPCPNETQILQNRNIRADQMAFLLTRVKNPESRIFSYARELFGAELDNYSF